MRTTGHYEYHGNTQHFIPEPLPPHDPLLIFDAPMATLYGDSSPMQNNAIPKNSHQN